MMCMCVCVLCCACVSVHGQLHLARARVLECAPSHELSSVSESPNAKHKFSGLGGMAV